MAAPRDPHRDRVLILDFGSQFTQLIARRIREQRVYCEIQPPRLDAAAVTRRKRARRRSSVRLGAPQ